VAGITLVASAVTPATLPCCSGLREPGETSSRSLKHALTANCCPVCTSLEHHQLKAPVTNLVGLTVVWHCTASTKRCLRLGVDARSAGFVDVHAVNHAAMHLISVNLEAFLTTFRMYKAEQGVKKTAYRNSLNERPYVKA
jgi:hypothetical protein